MSEREAANHIAGYALHNDYSERAFQLERGGQWVKGKSSDTFAPFGPFLATPDEVGDVQNLELWLKVNGEMVQRGNTSDMVFGVYSLVSYVSQFMTLLPGDVISTGTPAGVGMGFKPARFLRAGDVCELGIEGLGSSRQRAVACNYWTREVVDWGNRRSSRGVPVLDKGAHPAVQAGAVRQVANGQVWPRVCRPSRNA